MQFRRLLPAVSLICLLPLGEGLRASPEGAKEGKPDAAVPWGRLPACQGRGRLEACPTVPTVRVAGIVLKWVRTDREANYRRLEPLVREAAAKGARIICTTECFLDGYSIADKSIPLEKYRALGEPIPNGPYYRRLAELAASLKVHLIAGLLEAD